MGVGALRRGRLGRRVVTTPEILLPVLASKDGDLLPDDAHPQPS